MGSEEEKELPTDGDSISCEMEETEAHHVSTQEDLGPNHSFNEKHSEAVYGLHEKHTSDRINAKDIPIQEFIEKSLESSHSKTSVSAQVLQ